MAFLSLILLSYYRYIRCINLVIETKKIKDKDSTDHSVEPLQYLQQTSNDSSIRLKSLEGIGEGFFQLVFQTHFFSIKWILGGGSILYANDKADFDYVKGTA